MESAVHAVKIFTAVIQQIVEPFSQAPFTVGGEKSMRLRRQIVQYLVRFFAASFLSITD